MAITLYRSPSDDILDTPTIQIPNITINGNDYWDSHKTQYNNLIGTTAGPIILDLSDYPLNNIISIQDPSGAFKYTDSNDVEIVNYSFNKNDSENLTVKIVVAVQYVNLSLSYDNYSNPVPSYGWVKVNGIEVSVPSVTPIIKGQQSEVMLYPSSDAGPNYISINETMVSTEENIDMSHRVDVYRFTPTTDTSLGIYID